jgi:hypothetical protein
MARYERGRHKSLEQRLESKSGPQATAKASILHKKDRSPVTNVFYRPCDLSHSEGSRIKTRAVFVMMPNEGNL